MAASQPLINRFSDWCKLSSVLVFVSILCSGPILAEPDRPAVSVNLNHGSLKVSENGRYLVHEDGTPFFFLADTAWELLHRLNREEAEQYLENRRQKGFTVILTVGLAELDV